LRRRATASESLLWRALRDRQLDGWKFRRQARVAHSIVDFYCAEARLVIEVDGGVHALQREADAERQARIEDLGLRVIRLQAEEVERDVDRVLGLIGRACNSLTPGPSPSARERGGRNSG
jgi:very-short-patch-repair endonuclease